MAGPGTAFQAGDHASRPANGAGCILYACSTHSLIYVDDGSSWSTFATLTSGLTNPMSAEGDLIYSSDGSGTPARLAAGSDGEVLTLASGVPSWAAAGSGLSTGTSFPGTPSTGDRYRRSDLDYQVFFYDGTQWVTEQILTLAESNYEASGLTATASGRQMDAPTHLGAGIYVIDQKVSAFVGSTNDGSNYWTFQLLKQAAGGSTSGVGATLSTAAESPGEWFKVTGAVDSVVTDGTFDVLKYAAVKVSSPGTLYVLYSITYRLIAT